MLERFKQLLGEMNRGIYEKETEISLSLLAALAGESIILLGPPGVAKSMVARQLKTAFKNARSFEYLMSRFSTPDEIFGPVSIQKLKTSDTYERAVEGYLPTADVVFLDEIWKAGPAIQNTLLTVINEKIFRNGNREMHLPLKLLVAASNELPAKGEGLEALWDRFVIRIESRPIKLEKNFRAMLLEAPTDFLGPTDSTDSSGSMGKSDSADFSDLKITAEEYAEWAEKICKIGVKEEVLDAISAIRKSLRAVNVDEAVPFAADKNIGVDGLFTLTYTAASEGNIEEVGTAARSGGTGKAYVITLPEDTEIKAFAALQESATFSGIGTKLHSKGIPTVEEYIENEKFETQAPQYKLFIYKATTFKSGYQLPVRNVKGFGIYIQDTTVNSYDTIFVQIEAKQEGIGMEGEGTKESPYIIRTSENLKTISEKCNAGEKFANTYFKIADDVESITLPDEWTPIGYEKTVYAPMLTMVKGNPFSGNINGNGKTIIVPKDSLSLIGKPSGCTIENLNIYGEKIPGYGLVEGYTTNCTGTIRNITIKSGSHILKAGLLGGYGNESVNIYDCTIEKGVVIGDDGTWGDLGEKKWAYMFVTSPTNLLTFQDMIGSFCGAWNGTITNCVSYATVYGRNYVGGIVGFKGQSMRKCIVNNCAFYGDIIATGEGVGGIVGSGYLSGSAPNSPCVTIENCYAVGNIKGKDKVGGIFYENFCKSILLKFYSQN